MLEISGSSRLIAYLMLPFFVFATHHLTSQPQRSFDGNLMKVEIYVTPSCPYCVQAKSLLNRKGVAFTEVDLTKEPSRLPEMLARTHRKTVPQIFINNRHIGGFSDLAALESSGQLDGLLSSI